MAEAHGVEEDDGRGRVTATLAYVARSLVEHPDDVRIEVVEGDASLTLRLQVNPEDMGRVIGKAGHTARAIRQVVRAAASKAGLHTTVEIVE